MAHLWVWYQSLIVNKTYPPYNNYLILPMTKFQETCLSTHTPKKAETQVGSTRASACKKACEFTSHSIICAFQRPVTETCNKSAFSYQSSISSFSIRASPRVWVKFIFFSLARSSSHLGIPRFLLMTSVSYIRRISVKSTSIGTVALIVGSERCLVHYMTGGKNVFQVSAAPQYSHSAPVPSTSVLLAPQPLHLTTFVSALTTGSGFSF